MKSSRSRFKFRHQGRPLFKFIDHNNPKPVLLFSNDRHLRYTIGLLIVASVICTVIQYAFRK